MMCISLQDNYNLLCFNQKQAMNEHLIELNYIALEGGNCKRKDNVISNKLATGILSSNYQLRWEFRNYRKLVRKILMSCLVLDFDVAR